MSGLPWQGFLWTEDTPPRIFIKTRTLFTTKAVYPIRLLTAGLRNSQKDIRNWKTVTNKSASANRDRCGCKPGGNSDRITQTGEDRRCSGYCSVLNGQPTA